MVCAKNSAPLSGVVSKVSAGAMEVMDVYACGSMPRTLQAASEDGWNIVGTHAETCILFSFTTSVIVYIDPATFVFRRMTLEHQRKHHTAIPGASASEGSVACSEYKLQGPTILVLGSEGYGLRHAVQRCCDTMVRVDGGDPSQVVDSLNVSVATGILLHSLLQGRR